MAREGEKIRGYLVISAREANGKNKEEKVVWDPNFVEGFVKGACSLAGEAWVPTLGP